MFHGISLEDGRPINVFVLLGGSSRHNVAKDETGNFAVVNRSYNVFLTYPVLVKKRTNSARRQTEPLDAFPFATLDLDQLSMIGQYSIASFVVTRLILPFSVSFFDTGGANVLKHEVIIEREEISTSTNDYKSNSSDDLYDQAVALVARDRKASTSFIQRHLKIGYNRAATIIEKMETEGVVSSSNHVGKREVLIDDHSS